MKAIRIHKHGGPEVLRYEDVPVPKPRADEAVLKIEASGVNFIDIYFRTGLYKTELPFINGQEAAGVITEIGPGVRDIKTGDRVVYTGPLGAYAEYAAAPAARFVKIPDNLNSHTAAAAILQGMTVHYLTHSTFPLQAGQTALIHAAAGGVGLLLVQVAKMLGARVLATCSTDDKAARVKEVGADEVIVYSKTNFEVAVNRITGGSGVDVAYDSVGRSTWEGSMNCLRPRGMLVLFGNASGPVPGIEPLTLSKKGSLFLTRPSLLHYVAAREDLLKRAGDLFEWINSGKVQINIGMTLPLSEASEAHRRLAARETTGKVILLP